jgi:hypothetical protein
VLTTSALLIKPADTDKGATCHPARLSIIRSFIMASWVSGDCSIKLYSLIKVKQHQVLNNQPF